ncbi:hypothetical protein [Gloeobacter kilaueensis]|uniref:Uncharacterized protein n=1 Tax=Gloeobacter kilaueensis (strain ATCC BAA-2537 / CCAP 1431/1 / ULC 316 / JS1) TaxID=1183438 RepID=U5QF41_GLOK1|nr:hypothetical protein [Gloeobacter kilaueensis]AGY57483.1 hypothetical protein GKIL_1237 [Gloeobacter kilaueensis JS1]
MLPTPLISRGEPLRPGNYSLWIALFAVLAVAVAGFVYSLQPSPEEPAAPGVQGEPEPPPAEHPAHRLVPHSQTRSGLIPLLPLPTRPLPGGVTDPFLSPTPKPPQLSTAPPIPIYRPVPRPVRPGAPRIVGIIGGGDLCAIVLWGERFLTVHPGDRVGDLRVRSISPARSSVTFDRGGRLLIGVLETRP